jgi:hypothetical protein
VYFSPLASGTSGVVFGMASGSTSATVSYSRRTEKGSPAMTKLEILNRVSDLRTHAQHDLEDDRADRQLILEELLEGLEKLTDEAMGLGE